MPTAHTLPTVPRFIVRDRADTQAASLSKWSVVNPRYAILDTEAKGSQVYDEFTTKGMATKVARDLNQGAYGPLADVAS